MNIRSDRPLAQSDGGGVAASTASPQVVTVYLRDIALFKGLDLAVLEALAASLQARSVVAGEAILRRGEPIEHLHLLLSGRLQVLGATDTGQSINLASLSPGDFFGDLSIVDGLPATTTVVAETGALVALLPRANALDLMYRNPVIAERMLKRFAANIRAVTRQHAILALPSAFQRVVALLNQYSKVAPGGLVIIEKLPTQQEIASIVNTSRETVSRAIQALVQQGVIEKDTRRLIVRSPEALRQATSGDEVHMRDSE